MGGGVLAAARLQLGEAGEGEDVAEAGELAPQRLDLRQLLLVLDETSECSRTYWTSRGELFAYTGAPIAPIRPRAKSNRHHSRVVEARIENASPFFTPSARSPFARSSTRRAASDHETSTQAPSRSAR